MTRAMEVGVSVHDGDSEVHLVELHDARGGFLCRLFLQPTRSGCQVQLDTLEDAEDGGQGAILRVAQAATTVLIGVRRPVPS